MKHATGYYVYIYGERYWHRSLSAAIARAYESRKWCLNPQVIEIKTGSLMLGRPA